MLKEVKFVQKVLIKREQDFLSIQRSSTDETLPNVWDLPGGNIEQGEDLEVGLRREILEETGIQVGPIAPKFLTSFMQDGIYVIAAIYEAAYESGEIQLSNEHQNFSWLDKQGLLGLGLQPWILEVLRRNQDRV